VNCRTLDDKALDEVLHLGKQTPARILLRQSMTIILLLQEHITQHAISAKGQ